MTVSVFYLPLTLTLIRLIIAPFLFPLLIAQFINSPFFYDHFFLVVLIALIGLTDFFDGYIARFYNSKTELGRLLDPLADKLFLCSLVLSFLAYQKVGVYWVLLILGREFFVTTLREYASMRGTILEVSFLGKCKTTIQILCCMWLAAAPLLFFPQSFFVMWCEKIILIITAFITLLSGAVYAFSFSRSISI